MSVRVKGKWKHRVFAKVAERDGLVCAKCGVFEKKEWRAMGVWNGDDWPEDEVFRNRRTKVHLCSNLEVDHREPLWAGGSNDLTNLWLLCRPCHKTKTSLEQSKRLKLLGAGRNA